MYALTHHSRPSLTVEYCEGVVPHPNEDFSLPPGTAFIPTYSKLNLLAHYRCLRGHQEMAWRFLDESTEPVALLLEDDAVPNVSDWQRVVSDGVTALNNCPGAEVLSLHSRCFKRQRFDCIDMIGNREILRLKPSAGGSETDRGGRHHCFGSLAYLITRQAAARLSSAPWPGIPADIFLADHFNFIFLNPSPFNHDRRQGSIVEDRK